MNLRLVLVLSALFCGCEFLPGGGGGTGGGGGADGFTKGFVFVRRDDKNVYAADQRDYNVTVALTTEGGARQPSLSRDGRTVVFARTAGSDTELATVSVAGGMVSRVLAASAIPNGRNVKNPIFTADGSRIVFAYDEGTASVLGTVNTDGTGFARLIGGGSLSYASPSLYPDGTAVLAAAGNSSSTLTQLERVSLSSGSPMSVTNDLQAMGIATRVVISPDGTKAAFDARPTGTAVPRIFVIDLSTRAVNQVTDYPGDEGAIDASPCWLASDRVCFSSDSGGNDAVYALPAGSVKTSGGLQLPGATEPWYGPN